MPITPEILKAERITASEYERVCELMGREPNRAELGMFGVMWSEHCCYKNSKQLLKGFPTTGERVLVGPGENAGVIDFGEGLRVAFKIESHNHPSAVEPYQGAATGVGGILRDIFTMGARPIALLNSLRFGLPEEGRNRLLISGVVAGIAGYGNSVGVPTVAGEVYFDAAYNGNPLVNAMAIGLMELPEIMKSGAKGIGNPVIYAGSTTGRDGMGGASFASAELSEASEKDRPAVQVGDPFLEKLLIEACLEAFKTGAVVAAQDMGAAGLTCSTCEMAAKGGVGVTLDLDRVPVREKGMTPYEFLLSESQERMLLIGETGRETEIIEIFQRWGLHAVVVGEVIPEPLVKIYQNGVIVAEVPALALTEEAPQYQRDILTTPPDYVLDAWAWQPTAEHLTGNWNDVLLQLLASPSIASKQWIYSQYDYLIQNNSLITPGVGDAAVLRVRTQEFGMGEVPDLPTSEKGLAATVDCNSRWVYLDPYEGAKASVCEAARNLVCVGATPLAVTDNLNFGSPERPEIFWQMAESCRGISAACVVLETPVTGGNVSLYNEIQDEQGGSRAIYPTPTIGMVGIIEDLQRTCTLGFKQTGDRIVLLGPLAGGLGASEYLAVCHNTVAGRPLAVDLNQEQRVQACCLYLIQQGLLQSAHDASEGGLAVTLAESCFPAELGAQVVLAAGAGVAELFGEAASRIVVSVTPEHYGTVWDYVTSHLPTTEIHELGTVGSDALQIDSADTSLLHLPVAQLQNTWSQSLAQRMTRCMPSASKN